MNENLHPGTWEDASLGNSSSLRLIRLLRLSRLARHLGPGTVVGSGVRAASGACMDGKTHKEEVRISAASPPSPPSIFRTARLLRAAPELLIMVKGMSLTCKFLKCSSWDNLFVGWGTQVSGEPMLATVHTILIIRCTCN